MDGSDSYSDSPNFPAEDTSGPGYTSAILGVLAMALNMLMICSCYMTLLPGGILGMVAFVMARSALAEEPKGAARAYANVGQATGLIAMIYTLMFVAAFAAYIILYVATVLVVVIAEGM